LVLLFHGFAPIGIGRTPNGPAAATLGLADALPVADVAGADVVEAELPLEPPLEQAASKAASAENDTQRTILRTNTLS
jgi:hypothetical protein